MKLRSARSACSRGTAYQFFLATIAPPLVARAGLGIGLPGCRCRNWLKFKVSDDTPQQFVTYGLPVGEVVPQVSECLQALTVFLANIYAA